MKVNTVNLTFDQFLSCFNKNFLKELNSPNEESLGFIPQALYSEIIILKFDNDYKIAYADNLTYKVLSFLYSNKAINSTNYEKIKSAYLIVYYIICDTKVELDKIYNIYRGYNMNNVEDALIERIESEIEDDYSDDSLFNITSWGADLSFRELITMYEEGEMLKPELQRNYVWDKSEASRFVESILMGLPIPSIFLAQAGSEKLIIDGYQRIMTIYDYVRGIFSGDDKIFKLSNSNNINYRWKGKAFKELSSDEQRRIKSTTIHAIIFEQKKPKHGDTSMYQVFERINTSGRTLTPQEIRNCVYQGSFNTMLFDLNKNSNWRKLFGSNKADPRMRDLEFILRFFVIKSENIQSENDGQISLKKELNEYMGEHRSDSAEQLKILKKQFTDVIDAIYEKLGEKAFKNYVNGKFIPKFHPTIFDAITVAFYFALKEGREISRIPLDKQLELLGDEEFKSSTSVRTTDIENIKKRIELASKYLIG